MDASSEPRVELREQTIIVEVPRTPDRSNLQRCRPRAKVIAAREGLRTEPDVISYDGRPLRGLLRDPEGWIFTFQGADQMFQEGKLPEPERVDGIGPLWKPAAIERWAEREWWNTRW